MNIQPTYDWCGKPYEQAESVHPWEDKGGYWLCEGCEAKNRPHAFDPDKSRSGDGCSNQKVAERAASAVCEYTGICNPDEFNVADMITDVGHFCDREGHDFRALLRLAVVHWEEER